MLKFLGAIIIILCSGIIGLVVARNYSLRPQELRYLRNGMQMLETEILYGLTPLPQALQRVGSRLPRPINKLYIQTAALLINGEGSIAAEAWGKALENLEQESSLLPEDLDILYYFGQSLGGSDREEQGKNLKLVQEHLKNMEEKAENLKEKNQKLWQYLGFSMGTIIALVLF